MSKGAQTRQLIIHRAYMLTQKVGLEQVTLGMLAEHLELSKSGLFAHFRSKEALQVAVVEEAIERFRREVVMPALEVSRGVARLTALFERYLKWVKGPEGDAPRGCVIMALVHEFDDRPGTIHDLLVGSQRDWMDSLTRVARGGVDARDFRDSTDPRQVAFELEGILMAFQLTHKALGLPRAEAMARTAFASLLERIRSIPRWP